MTSSLPDGALRVDEPTHSVRMDYRLLPLETLTSFGPVSICPRCGKCGAEDSAHRRIVHVAWHSGQLSLASVSCRTGSRR